MNSWIKKSAFSKVIFCVISSLFLFGNIELSAQNSITLHAGARGLAMGNASVAFQDINSIFSNQAGLVNLTNPSFILFSEQRFALQEIRSIAAGAVYPTKSGVFGLSINYYGFEEYNEQKIGLAYSRKLAEKLSFGAQVNYLNYRIPEYGNKGFLSFEVGLQIQILKELTIAAHLVNPIGQEIVENENLPTVFKIGGAYQPSKKVIISLEVEKDIDFKTRIKGGIEYQLIDAFALRVGFADNPNSFNFGVGYKLKEKLNIDIGVNYHQVLGFSPGLGLVYQINKKIKN
jgi:hypothetical protein